MDSYCLRSITSPGIARSAEQAKISELENQREQLDQILASQSGKQQQIDSKDNGYNSETSSHLNASSNLNRNLGFG